MDSHDKTDKVSDKAEELMAAKRRPLQARSLTTKASRPKAGRTRPRARSSRSATTPRTSLKGVKDSLKDSPED